MATLKTLLSELVDEGNATLAKLDSSTELSADIATEGGGERLQLLVDHGRLLVKIQEWANKY
jgi:hypothetical protein